MKPVRTSSAWCRKLLVLSVVVLGAAVCTRRLDFSLPSDISGAENGKYEGTSVTK